MGGHLVPRSARGSLPDIGDNYVTVITQWAGRSAEEVEQQVTIPIEIQMAGMPHMTFLRSESIFGLSFVS